MKADKTICADGSWRWELQVTSGCDRHSNKEVFYLVAANLALPYWQTAAAGFNHAAAQFKVTARVVGPSELRSAGGVAGAAEGCGCQTGGHSDLSCRCVGAAAGDRRGDSVGIPVITIDSDAAGSRRLYFIGTNNLEAGRVGGSRLIEKLGGKGNVVFFTLAGSPTSNERLKGFKDVLASAARDPHRGRGRHQGRCARCLDKAQELVALTGPKKIDAFVCLESSAGKPVRMRSSAPTRRIGC